MAQENDLVLIFFEDKPLVFARIESILPDSKPNWYHVRLLLLQIPLQVVTWILRDVYIDGAEFTMHGKRMRLEKVAAPEDAPSVAAREKEQKSAGPAENANNTKVISLAELKKK